MYGDTTVKFSSIFSFETLRQVPLPTRAAGLAVALFALARLALYLGSEVFLFVPESNAQRLYLNNEASYRISGNPRPEVLIMGTSRLGILPHTELSGELGLKRDKLANFSLAGNSFWRTLTLLRRNPELLADAKTIVIDLLPFELYVSKLASEDDNLFLRLAIFEERMLVHDPVDRARALADVATAAWSDTHNPSAWLWGASFLALSEPDRNRRYLDAAKRKETPFDLRPDVSSLVGAGGQMHGRGYAPRPVVSDVQVHSLYALSELLPRDCVLVLIWLPVRPDFAEALRHDPEMRESFQVFQETLESIQLPNVRTVWPKSIEEEAFASDQFRDVVHYSPEGIRRVSTVLANAIREAQATSN